MYLLNVLSEDKTAEITSLIVLRKKYSSLSAHLPSHLTSLLLKTALEHHTKRFDNPTYAGLITSITAEPTVTPSLTVPRDPGGRNVSALLRTLSSIGMASPVVGPQAYPASTINSMLPPPISSNTSISSSSSPKTLPNQSNPPPPFNLPLTYSQPQSAPSHRETETSNSEDDTNLTLRPQSFLPPPPSKPPSRHAFLSLMEEVLGKFWNSETNEGRDDEWRIRVLGGGLEGSEKDWVYLCTPFVCCLSQPIAVYCGFQKLMERICGSSSSVYSKSQS